MGGWSQSTLDASGLRTPSERGDNVLVMFDQMKADVCVRRCVEQLKMGSQTVFQAFVEVRRRNLIRKR